MESPSPVTSFRKKGAIKFPPIPGTKPSHQTFQLLTSSGIPSLDGILGGGFPIGSVCLIIDDDADSATSYSKVILKHFMGEGCAQGQDLFVASCQGTLDVAALVPEIVRTKESASKPTDNNSKERLEIAWRYKNQSGGKLEPPSVKQSYHFNLQKNVGTSDLDKCQVVSWQSKVLVEASNEYRSAFQSLFNTLSKPQYSTDPTGTKNLLRIAFERVGECLWCQDEKKVELNKFLLALRSLARNRLCSVALTASKDDVDEFKGKIFQAVDYVILLRPFDEKTRLTFKDHHGFLEVARVATFHTLQSHQSQSVLGKYLFKSTRTKFVIERIHLPPELGEEPKVEDKNNKSIDF